MATPSETSRAASQPTRRLNGEALISAAKMGKLAVLKELIIDKGYDVNAVTESGQTALKAASYVGKSEAVKFLLENGANPNIADDEGYTPLINVLARLSYARDDTPRLAIVGMLLEHGARTDVVTSDGSTVWTVAVATGRDDVIKVMVQHDADPNQTVGSRGLTPLMFAAHKGRPSVIRALLDSGASPLSVDGDGDTCLHYACQIGGSAGPVCTEIVELLCSAGAEAALKNKKGFTPLHLASMSDLEDVCVLLMTHGASVHDTAMDGQTALDCCSSTLRTTLLAKEESRDHAQQAISSSNSSETASDVSPDDHIQKPSPSKRPCVHSAVKLGNIALHLVEDLLAKGADINEQDEDGWTPLKVATRKGDKQLVEYLFSKGADPSICDYEHYAPLHNAADNMGKGRPNDMEVLRMFVEHPKINLDVKTEDGRTPLIMLSHYWCADGVRLLLSRGSSVHTTDLDGDSALHHACRNERPETPALLLVLEALISHGANVNGHNDRGYTPLHWSVHRKHWNAAKKLLQNGASLRETDDMGRTPVHLLSHYEYEDTVRLMRIAVESGAEIPNRIPILERMYCMAAGRGDVATLKLCLDNGVSVAYCLMQNVTTLSMAAAKLHVDIVSELVLRGADINRADKDGDTPLINVTRLRVEDVEDSEGIVEMARLLLESGAAVNAQNKRGYTALHWCVYHNNEELALLLMEAGADPCLADEEGRSPLALAPPDLLPKLLSYYNTRLSPLTTPSSSSSSSLTPNEQEPVIIPSASSLNDQSPSESSLQIPSRTSSSFSTSTTTTDVTAPVPPPSKRSPSRFMRNISQMLSGCLDMRSSNPSSKPITFGFPPIRVDVVNQSPATPAECHHKPSTQSNQTPPSSATSSPLRRILQRTRSSLSSSSSLGDRERLCPEKKCLIEEHVEQTNRLIRELTCPICNDILRNPYQLKCLHNFCKECLDDMAREGAPSGLRIKCPTCRSECKSRDILPHFTLKNIADMLVQPVAESNDASSRGSTSSSSHGIEA
eukprot:CAMPEP_0184655204 /NCGR_PEP_ID=MMETSP0308-20130426/12817_1 /TAXON_ID=38269 /ORGANISM="Gloeochaete witrockiana, Strain SAG 46.84" /LENGTH=1011 /DNA_ID=CAMNT_0027091533 /DNA_START=381 /DNA_END=3416 /DNA_ORIENTATION=+